MTITDLRTSPPPGALETDICVIGAGAAGITLAAELGRAGRDVLLLESGGFEPEEDIQALNDLAITGHPVRENFMSRARYYGGSCNLWAGRSMRLSAEDMGPASDPHGIGWPIASEQLDRWYPRAAEVLGLPSPHLFEPAAWADVMGAHERRLFDSDAIRPTVSLWGRRPMRFGEAYRSELRRSGRVGVLLHANAMRLRLAKGAGAVEALEVGSLDGARCEIRSRRYVVACGGVENPRLLLLAGIGAEHGVVGRYFMDHPRAVFGRVRLARGARLPLLRGRPLADGRMQLGIGLAPAVRRAEGLLNHHATLESELSGYAVGAPSLATTAKELMPHSFHRLYWEARNALHPRPDGASRVVVYFCEQAPDPESRVVLGTTRDALGLPRAELHWRIDPQVTRGVLVLQEQLRARIREAGIGELEPGEAEPRYTDASHHMGTTRMSRDPRTGVVDADCRVHGIGNLYLAGSSVFPSAGHANPTPTIIALALRLADHLRSRRP